MIRVLKNIGRALHRFMLIIKIALDYIYYRISGFAKPIMMSMLILAELALMVFIGYHLAIQFNMIKVIVACVVWIINSVIYTKTYKE